jgi:polar amino acid transport system substrate-binding protein
VQDGDGAVRGVTIDLGGALAQALGVKAEPVSYPSSGEITKAAGLDAWDVTFMPVDEERKLAVSFSTNYGLGESTYLVAPGSSIRSIEEVDRPGVRVVGVDNTTTIRAVRRVLKQASVQGAQGAGDTLALMRGGDADVIALGRDTLGVFAAQLPGARVLDGHVWAVGYAAAVQNGKPAALGYVTAFIEAAKADGTVRRIFDRHGLNDAPLAPPGSRS